jgi:hypothetical protein
VTDTRKQKYLDVIIYFKTRECKTTKKKEAQFRLNKTFINRQKNKIAQRKMSLCDIFVLQKAS